mgnify:CR=1 FL=1
MGALGKYSDTDSGVGGLSTAAAGNLIGDNEVIRGDGTSGIQGSGVTLSDIAAFAAITPTAAAGASQAGIPTSLAASPAVASTDTNGAAAGGSVTLTAGAAARLVSGNADGGSVVLTPGVGIGTGITGLVSAGGFIAYPGTSFLAANGTNATATLATTGLSVTVSLGRKYFFEAILFLADSTVADGAVIDFDGGSATATNFICYFEAHGSVTKSISEGSSVTLATDFSVATVDAGVNMFRVTGSFEPSATGTFIPRYAQVVHTTGTLTIYRGSILRVWDFG